MSLKSLSDKLNAVMDSVHNEKLGAGSTSLDMNQPLLAIQKETIAVLNMDSFDAYSNYSNSNNMSIDDNDEWSLAETRKIGRYLEMIQPKIEYLFWLSQNIENDQIFQQLSEFLNYVQRMEEKYHKEKKRSTSKKGRAKRQRKAQTANELISMI